MALSLTQVSVLTSATLLLTAPSGWVFLQNIGTVPVFVGPATVTTSGSTQGISLAASGVPVPIFLEGSSDQVPTSLYGIAGTTGQTVIILSTTFTL